MKEHNAVVRADATASRLVVCATLAAHLCFVFLELELIFPRSPYGMSLHSLSQYSVLAFSKASV